MGLLALASGTAHKEVAPVMHTCTQGDGSGDAHLQQIHKSLVNIFSITCVAMLRCSLVLYVVLRVCTSAYTKQWRQPVAVVDGAAGAGQWHCTQGTDTSDAHLYTTMALVMRTCSRYTRAHLQCCVVRVFYMLSSLFVHLARLSSGAGTTQTCGRC